MAIREFTVRQILPLVSRLSEKNFERVLSLARRTAPDEATKLVIDTINKLRKEQHPMIELLKRVTSEPNPRVKERLINI